MRRTRPGLVAMIAGRAAPAACSSSTPNANSMYPQVTVVPALGNLVDVVRTETAAHGSKR